MKYKIALIFILTLFGEQISHSATIFHTAKGPVERAGVILVKKYKKEPGKYSNCILVGHDATFDYVNFPGGGCEHQDGSPAATAQRETFEETGGSLQLPNLSTHPSIYNKHTKIQLFLFRKDDLKVTDLSRAVKSARKNPLLGHQYKEMDDYYAIPVKHILDAAFAIKSNRFPPRSQFPGRLAPHAGFHKGQRVYWVKSRNGHNLPLHYNYLSTIARDFTQTINGLMLLLGSDRAGIQK